MYLKENKSAQHVGTVRTFPGKLGSLGRSEYPNSLRIATSRHSNLLTRMSRVGTNYRNSPGISDFPLHEKLFGIREHFRQEVTVSCALPAARRRTRYMIYLEVKRPSSSDSSRLVLDTRL